jgi:hypothetical protein
MHLDTEVDEVHPGVLLQMKRFNFLPQAKKASVISAISLVALTGLIAGKATSENTNSAEIAERLALEAAVFEAESMPSAAEEEFLESLGAADEAELAEILSGWKESFTYTAAGGMKAKNAFCERFIDQSGAYGVYGKVIESYLKEKLKHSRTTPMLADDLVGMETAPKICPNWRKFDDAMKIKFWVWTFGAMASLESSCGADKRAINGVGGTWTTIKNKKILLTAIGLYQLEKQRSARALFRRGIPSCTEPSDTEIGKTIPNSRCAIDIMEFLVSEGPGDLGPSPIYRGPNQPAASYWLKLASTMSECHSLPGAWRGKCRHAT